MWGKSSYESPCETQNVTYSHRVDDPANYNYCVVPESGADAILFAAFALMMTIIFSTGLSALYVLLAGAGCEALSWMFNLGRFSNAIALWLGMKPSDIFFYIFLPPLLLDSAVRIDFYVFRKIMSLCLAFAFGLVALSTFLSIPIMLYGLNLEAEGWTWVHAALFCAMVASTDAVAVTNALKSGGAPEVFSALLEGESLFNDATGLVLYDIFLKMLMQMQSNEEKVHTASRHHHFAQSQAEGGPGGVYRAAAAAVATIGSSASSWMGAEGSEGGDLDAADVYNLSAGFHGVAPEADKWGEFRSEVADVLKQFFWLAGLGTIVGFVFGFATMQLLRWLQWRRVPPHVEVAVTLGGTYLCFYVSTAYLESSGVMACVIYGLTGSASMSWHMSLKAKRSAMMQHFWDVLAFAMNGIIFFYVGASATNYLIRLSVDLHSESGAHGVLELVKDIVFVLPAIYIILSVLRLVLIAASVRLGKLLGAGDHISWQGIIFITFSGLRGAVCLILAQSVLTMESAADPKHYNASFGPDGVSALGAEDLLEMDYIQGRRKKERKVMAQMGLWTVGFMMLTLLINGPLITPMIRWLGLSKASTAKKQIRSRARAALLRFTASALEELRTGAGDGALRGADWSAVARFVDLEQTLDQVLPKEDSSKRPQALPAAMDATAEAHAEDDLQLSDWAPSSTPTGFTPPSLSFTQPDTAHDAAPPADSHQDGEPTEPVGAGRSRGKYATGADAAQLQQPLLALPSPLDDEADHDVEAGGAIQATGAQRAKAGGGSRHEDGHGGQGPAYEPPQLAMRGGGQRQAASDVQEDHSGGPGLQGKASAHVAKSEDLGHQEHLHNQQQPHGPKAADLSLSERSTSPQRAFTASGGDEGVQHSAGSQHRRPQLHLPHTSHGPPTGTGPSWKPPGSGSTTPPKKSPASKELSKSQSMRRQDEAYEALRSQGDELNSFFTQKDKKDKKDKEEKAKPPASALSPSTSGTRGGAAERNSSAAAAVAQNGSASQEQQLRGQAPNQPPHTVVNVEEPEEGQALLRAGSRDRQGPEGTGGRAEAPAEEEGHEGDVDGDDHEEDSSPLHGFSDFQDIQVPDDSTLAQFVAELEHEHADHQLQAQEAARQQQLGGTAPGSSAVNEADAHAHAGATRDAQQPSKGAAGKKDLMQDPSLRVPETEREGEDVEAAERPLGREQQQAQEGLQHGAAGLGGGRNDAAPPVRRAPPPRDLSVPTHTGAVVMSGIEPPPLPPAQPTRVLSTRTSPPMPAAQDLQQQQQQQEGAQGSGGNVNHKSGTPPTATPGEAGTAEMPGSPFAGDSGGSTGKGGTGQKESDGAPDARQPQGGQPGPSSAASGGAGHASALQPVQTERKLSHTHSAFSGLESRRVPSATDLATGDFSPRALKAVSRSARRSRHHFDPILALDPNHPGYVPPSGLMGEALPLSEQEQSMERDGGRARLRGGRHTRSGSADRAGSQGSSDTGGAEEGSRGQHQRSRSVTGQRMPRHLPSLPQVVDVGGSLRFPSSYGSTPTSMGGALPSSPRFMPTRLAPEGMELGTSAQARKQLQQPYRNTKEIHMLQPSSGGGKMSGSEWARLQESLQHSMGPQDRTPSQLSMQKLAEGGTAGQAATRAAQKTDSSRSAASAAVPTTVNKGPSDFLGGAPGSLAAPPEGAFAAIAGAGSTQSGELSPGPPPGGGAPGGAGDGHEANANAAMVIGEYQKEALAEYRMRLLNGLKRHFHTQHIEGLLSTRGLRGLDAACDAALDTAETPLDLWERVEAEISGGQWVALSAAFHFQLRRAILILRKLGPCANFLVQPLYWMSQVLGASLSKSMLAGVEVALEVHTALNDTPQAQWLEYAGHAGQVVRDELDAQSDAVWHFIIDREIEAPDRFQAIQTHRAAIAVLRHQAVFVAQLTELGMVDEREQDKLLSPIERRMWKLDTKGPRWKHPSLHDVLMGVPFLRHISPTMFEWLRQHGELAGYRRGDVIADLPLHAAAPSSAGLFIVVSGMVRIILHPPLHNASGHPHSAHPHFPHHGETLPGAAKHAGKEQGQAAAPLQVPEEEQGEEFFVGTGGVGGLTQALLGRAVPGMSIRLAVAEGNALGKGPLVFHMRPQLIAAICVKAARGDEDAQTLERAMFRQAGGFILERQRHDVVSNIVQLLVSAVHMEEQRHRAHAARHAAAADADPQGAGQDRGGWPGHPHTHRHHAHGLRHLIEHSTDHHTKHGPHSHLAPTSTQLHHGAGAASSAVGFATAADTASSSGRGNVAGASLLSRTLSTAAAAHMADAWAHDPNGGVTMNDESGALGGPAHSRTPPRNSLSSGADNRPGSPFAAQLGQSQGRQQQQQQQQRTSGSTTPVRLGDGLVLPMQPNMMQQELGDRVLREAHEQEAWEPRGPLPVDEAALSDSGDSTATGSTTTTASGYGMASGEAPSAAAAEDGSRATAAKGDQQDQQQQQQQQQAVSQPGRSAPGSTSFGANVEEERLTRRCFERALDMYEALKTAIANSELVRLAPRQTITQHSTMLLVNGSLVQSRPLPRMHNHQPGRGNSTLGGSSSVPSLPVYKPPGLIMWLPDFFEYGIAKYFRRSETVTFTAGPTGAALLVCEVSDVTHETAPQGAPTPPPVGTFPTPNTPLQPNQADPAAASQANASAAPGADNSSAAQSGLVTAPGAFYAAPPPSPGQGANEAGGAGNGAGRGMERTPTGPVPEATTDEGATSAAAAAAAAKAVSGAMQRAKSMRWNV